jgi:response regulator RpfG family c-di-GMP phosphodiesterase
MVTLSYIFQGIRTANCFRDRADEYSRVFQILLRDDHPVRSTALTDSIDKILFVDDEPALLGSYERLLRREFEVHIAESGERGLESIQKNGPYAVVISDMRMPEMSGDQFLAQVRQRAPDTVRMLLTGYSDVDATKAAVNDGHIFSFLTKPCAREVLTKAISIGAEQYHLMVNERELLEKTLMGSIQVLMDVLSTTSREAYGRSVRIARYVRHLVDIFGLPSPWRFEAAAMLSQLGCVTLDADLIQRVFAGDILAPEDQVRYDAHPQAARHLLASIPRLEAIAWMIGQQLTKQIPDDVPGVPLSSVEEIVMGAKVLKLAVAFDYLRTTKSLSETEAISRLRERQVEFSQELLDALAQLKQEASKAELRKVATSNLTSGMILDHEIRNRQGALLVPAGHEVTFVLAMKLRNLSRAGMIAKEIMAFVPL